jgi:hypothetical protein
VPILSEQLEETKDQSMKNFFTFIPLKHQPLMFTVIAALIGHDLIGDVRSEIIDILHLDSASVFILDSGDSFTSVTRGLIRYGLKIISLFVCFWMIRRATDDKKIA